MMCNSGTQCCAARRTAQMAGEMYYHDHISMGGDMSGWVYPSVRPTLGQRLSDGFRLYFWLECPFCSGLLPSLESAWRRLLREIQHEARFPDWLHKKPKADWQQQADGEGEE